MLVRSDILPDNFFYKKFIHRITKIEIFCTVKKNWGFETKLLKNIS